MCGILGIVAGVGREVTTDRRHIIAMRDEMQARGPDASGFYQHQNVAFAHRRLAIRDVAGGGQPWISPDGDCVLVYNGEIYNDAELRQELEADGHRFRSHCDTEVLMEAYRRWGVDCLQRLRGMFAFGVYDFAQNRLVLARDRFGIKPLYFADAGGELVFASSIAAILQHPRISRLPNLKTVSHYLTTFRTTLGPETMYAGIEQLQPGEYMAVERGNRRIVRYWEPPAKTQVRVDYESAAAELETTLQEAVNCRLASDVPVGAFISGGVDSNTLLSLMPQARQAGLKTFCGGGNDDSPDFDYARRCAGHFGCDHEDVRVDAETYLQSWRELVDRQRLPLSTPSDVIIYRLAARMKQEVGVALGGEGADELLCGYAVQHWSGCDYDLSQAIASNCWQGTIDQAQRFQHSLKHQYGRLQFASESEHYFALNSLIPSAVKPQLLQPWVWKSAEGDEPMYGFYQDLFDGRDGESTQRKLAAVMHHVNLESLLARLDRSTMAASLEARVPYTDHLLVEKMFRLPMNYKIDVAHHELRPHLASAELSQRGSLRSKRLLRTVADRRLPTELAQRKKASFPTPVAGWLSGPWQSWAQRTLLASPFARNLFQPQPLQELAQNPEAAGMWLWPLLNLAQWGDREFTAA